MDQFVYFDRRGRFLRVRKSNKKQCHPYRISWVDNISQADTFAVASPSLGLKYKSMDIVINQVVGVISVPRENNFKMC